MLEPHGKYAAAPSHRERRRMRVRDEAQMSESVGCRRHILRRSNGFVRHYYPMREKSKLLERETTRDGLSSEGEIPP